MKALKILNSKCNQEYKKKCIWLNHLFSKVQKSLPKISTGFNKCDMFASKDKHLHGNVCSIQIVLCEAESKNRGQGKGKVSYWQCVLSNNSLNPLLNQTLILWKLLRPNSCRFLLESDLKKESRLVLLRDLKSSSEATLTSRSFVRKATPWKTILSKKVVCGCVWIGL